MAIREYGESLLLRQSLKRDQRERKERRDARRASRDELAVKAVSWLGKEALGMARTAIEGKTNAYINNSNAYDTKVKLGQAETLVNEYNAFKTAALENNTTFEDQVLRDTAEQAVTAYGLKFSGSVVEKNTPAMTSYFMKKQDVKDLAAERTAFYKDVGKFSVDFLKGKTQTPLQGLIDKRKPKSVLGYAARALTGRLPNTEAFNAEIDELIQVQAANGILTRKSEAVKNAVLEGALTSDEAKIFMPELEQIQKDEGYNKAVRLLDTTTLMDSQTGIEFKGNKVYRRELSQRKDFRNNIVSTGFEFVEVQDIDLTKPLTTDDIVKMSGEIADLSEHASKILNAQGFNDYSKEAAALLRTFDGKIGTEYLLAVSSLLYSQKFTDPKNFKKDISAEQLKQMYFLEEEIIKATSENMILYSGRLFTTNRQIDKWKALNPNLDLKTERPDLFRQQEENTANLNAVMDQRKKEMDKVRKSYFETTIVTPKTSVDLTSTEWATTKNWAVEEDTDGTRRLINRDNNEFIYFLRGTNQVQDENGVIRNFTAEEQLGIPTT